HPPLQHAKCKVDAVLAPPGRRHSLPRDVLQPSQLRRMQRQRWVAMPLAPDAPRIGAPCPGGRSGLPTATIGLVNTVDHALARETRRTAAYGSVAPSSFLQCAVSWVVFWSMQGLRRSMCSAMP